MPFRDRVDAGRQLAQRLLGHAAPAAAGGVVVAGLPRGGVPVAYEVAGAVGAPLDVLLVRKLGAPHQPELAMGAIGEGGVRVLNREVLASVAPRADELARIERAEQAELERRARRFRGERDRVPVVGRTVIVVDDGIATGSTARAACLVARAAGAAAVADLHPDADDVVCLETPDWFSAIGELYADFTQTSDEEVVSLLARAAGRGASGSW